MAISVESLDALVPRDVRDNLRRYAVLRGSPADEADDFVQEAICRALARFDPGSPAPLEGWLRVVIARLVVDQQRRRAREGRFLARWVANEDAEPATDPSEEVTQKALADWARSLVDDLCPTQQEIVLAVARGESVADIAARTGRSIRSVEGHLRRARRTLRNHVVP